MASNPPVWEDLPGNDSLLTVVDVWKRFAFSGTQTQLRARLNRAWTTAADAVQAEWYNEIPEPVLVLDSTKAGVELWRPRWTRRGLVTTWGMGVSGTYCALRSRTTASFPPAAYFVFTAKRPASTGPQIPISPFFEAAKLPVRDVTCY